ncbi:MAG: DnaJ domain-containing protein [Candidatus Thermoplasmatota archaeon]|nr:DnaJ domain-containing protein [Candidatus Thermoplasmatota archaeon]
MPDYYTLLGVSRESSEEEIKSSYKALIKKWHPDVGMGDSTTNQLMTRQLNEAYEVLSDRIKRRLYDIAQEKAKNEREKWVEYAKRQQNAEEYRKRTVRGPSVEHVEENERKNKAKIVKQRIEKWMIILSKYMVDHQWASSTFEQMPESIRLKTLAGNLTLEDVFLIYCTFQIEKSKMGIKTSYFNPKKIKQMLDTSKSHEDMEVGMQLISKEELILQLNLKVKAGLFNKVKLTEDEYRVIQKFMKFHKYLLNRSEDFFAGVNKFSITKGEWELAKELIKTEAKI